MPDKSHKKWSDIRSPSADGGDDLILVQDGDGPIDILVVDADRDDVRREGTLQGASSDKTFEPPIDDGDIDLEPRDPVDPAGGAPGRDDGGYGVSASDDYRDDTSTTAKSSCKLQEACAKGKFYVVDPEPFGFADASMADMPVGDGLLF